MAISGLSNITPINENNNLYPDMNGKKKKLKK